MHSTPAKILIDTQCGLRFAKGPRWNDGKLIFLDVHHRCIKSVDLHGDVRVVSALPYLPGEFGVLIDGRLIVGDAQRRIIFLLDEAGETQVADLSNIAKYFLSDSATDNLGGIYVADAGFDFMDPLVDPVPSGFITYIRADGKASVVAEDLFFPNGLIVTPDNKTLLVAETLGHRLTAFEIDGDGSLKNRRVWAQFQDDIKPEGICFDRESAIWVAGAGPLALHVREGGEVDHQVSTEQPVFATMLGGPELKHLFLCTSASNDPVITRRTPSATIDVAEVKTPGVQFSCGSNLVGSQTVFASGAGVTI